MLKTFVLDASVILKTVLPEENDLAQKKALKIFKFYSERKVEILLPSFWVYEVGNILAMKLDPDKANLGFDFLLSQQFLIYNFLPSELKEICLFANQSKTSFYDASYHLLAKFVDGTLVTADKKYQQKFPDDKNILLLEEFKL